MNSNQLQITEEENKIHNLTAYITAQTEITLTKFFSSVYIRVLAIKFNHRNALLDAYEWTDR